MWQRPLFLAAFALSAMALASAAGAADALRVCADPDNLPFSHEDGSGFENRIARLLADDLGAPLQYEWLPDRRAFVRKTLGAGLCDVIIGVPVDFERVLPTRPYYRSTYVFVEREPKGQPPLVSFDDPRIRQRRIGIQLIGNDLLASPPGYALTRHGAIDNVVGVTLAGDTPPADRLLRSLAAGQLDAALVWGPQAGYYAMRSPVPLRISPAVRPADLPLPFEFSIAMGVRRGDKALQSRLDEVIERRGADIRRILVEYGVPLVPEPRP
ncbi:MAG: extracellular solute-binding protein family 3 [Gemmatimonadetes bacterium]|nr:extracellular solute-binding protein family 3 [Gemmatimonadota bacterium]